MVELNEKRTLVEMNLKGLETYYRAKERLTFWDDAQLPTPNKKKPCSDGDALTKLQQLFGKISKMCEDYCTSNSESSESRKHYARYHCEMPQSQMNFRRDAILDAVFHCLQTPSRAQYRLTSLDDSPHSTTAPPQEEPADFEYPDSHLKIQHYPVKDHSNSAADYCRSCSTEKNMPRQPLDGNSDAYNTVIHILKTITEICTDYLKWKQPESESSREHRQHYHHMEMPKKKQINNSIRQTTKLKLKQALDGLSSVCQLYHEKKTSFSEESMEHCAYYHRHINLEK